MYKTCNKKLKWHRSNLRLGVQFTSTVEIIVQITTSFLLALRFEPMNWRLWKDNSTFRVSSNWFHMSRHSILGLFFAKC